jgi:hypothetical protein
LTVRKLTPVIALCVGACASAPTGPAVMVLPAAGKSFEQFQTDDAACRSWASQQARTTSTDTPPQHRYDIAYTQCMYGKGHQIPALASPEPRPAPAIPPPAAQVVPDLRGTWTGTWAQRPMTLLLLKQEEFPVGSVYIGPWAPFAQREPGLSGILTFTVRDEAISVNVRGRFAGANGGRALVLEPLTANGQQIVLTRVERDYLSGVGTSRASWEPSGPVELVRRVGP